MAYRHYSGAPALYCRARKDGIEVKELSGNIKKYGCALGFDTDWQLTVFKGKAQWCLLHEDVLYVGRPDGTFSGFQKSGLLVRYGAWKVPSSREFKRVGQKDGYYAILDVEENVVYVDNVKQAYRLNAVLEEDCLEGILMYAKKRSPDLTLLTEGGLKVDVTKSGRWVTTPERGWDGVPIIL